MQNGQAVEGVFYRGSRSYDGAEVTRVNGPEHYPLPWRLDLRNHSPTGLEFGYGGSGPSQLALALLADATGDAELSCRYYQDFKWEVVATLSSDRWELTQTWIKEWVRRRLSRGED